MGRAGAGEGATLEGVPQGRVPRSPAYLRLDHYAHFMPEAGGKGRTAIDVLLGLVPEYMPENLAGA
ncbi:hypothetical protein GCM10009612_49130 [Streptomyces beijiangensis]